MARWILATAVVAAIQRAIRADRQPVRTAARVADLCARTIRADARAAASGDFSQDDGAIGHDDGTFGETEIARHDTHVRHVRSPATVVPSLTSVALASTGGARHADCDGRFVAQRVTSHGERHDCTD
jgi:hypothetical protein